MKSKQLLCFIILIILLSACKPDVPEEVHGEKHIIVHAQYEYDDQIGGSGWEIGSTITLEIDDPSNGSGVDYSDSQEAKLTEVENITVNFYPGNDWDLKPGHIITLSDGETTVTHVVQDLTIETVDIEKDLIQGTAKPGSEVMVWIEEPEALELRVNANSSGSWMADFTGIFDIDEDTVVAAAQNDTPPTGDSHTRFNWPMNP